jgi:transposase
MAHVTVMTGPERRRRWSLEDRRRILTAAFLPDAVVADVARQFDIITSLVYKWRRQALAERGDAAFAQAILIDEGASPSPQPRASLRHPIPGKPAPPLYRPRQQSGR